MSENLSAEFASYRQAEEAANKLLAIRASQIGIALADPSAGASPAAAPIAESASDAPQMAGLDVELAEELPPYHGNYRLTASVPPDVRALAERIVRSCAGKME